MRRAFALVLAVLFLPCLASCGAKDPIRKSTDPVYSEQGELTEVDYGSFTLKYPTALQAKKTESPIKEDEKGSTYLLLEVANETGTFSVARIRISEKEFAKNIENRVQQTRKALETELGTDLLGYESEVREWKSRQTLILRYSYPFGEGYTMYKTQYFMMAGQYTYVFTTSNIDSEISEVQQIMLDSICVQNQDGPAIPSVAPSLPAEGAAEGGNPDEGTGEPQGQESGQGDEPNPDQSQQADTQP